MEVLYPQVSRALFAHREGMMKQLIALMTTSEREELQEETSQLIDEAIRISVLLKELEHDGITS